jgi:hypothetical protein
VFHYYVKGTTDSIYLVQDVSGKTCGIQVLLFSLIHFLNKPLRSLLGSARQFATGLCMASNLQRQEYCCFGVTRKLILLRLEEEPVSASHHFFLGLSNPFLPSGQYCITFFGIFSLLNIYQATLRVY